MTYKIFLSFELICVKSFILEMPPKIAAVWFPATEVSTATSVGVFGNQVGIALGFLIPPLIITGPVSSYQGVSNQKNGTFNGTFPIDFRNIDRWSEG